MKVVERDSLYNIYQREKARVGDQFTLFYNQEKEQLQYRSEEGTLTLKLFDNGRENLYYRDNSKTRKGIGELLKETYNYGSYGEMEELMWDIPEKFQKLAQSLQFEREKLGIEKDRKQRGLIIE